MQSQSEKQKKLKEHSPKSLITVGLFIIFGSVINFVKVKEVLNQLQSNGTEKLNLHIRFCCFFLKKNLYG